MMFVQKLCKNTGNLFFDFWDKGGTIHSVAPGLPDFFLPSNFVFLKKKKMEKMPEANLRVGRSILGVGGRSPS